MSQDGKKPTDQDEKNEESAVIDFSEKRAQRLAEKHRKAERVFFKQMLGIYCVTEGTELRAVELMDVSEEGCSFQVEFNSADPWPRNTQEIPLRLYFSQDTYLPVTLTIQNSRPCTEDDIQYIRYGCQVDSSVASYDAYVQFVRFVTFYSKHAHDEKGQNRKTGNSKT